MRTTTKTLILGLVLMGQGAVLDAQPSPAPSAPPAAAATNVAGGKIQFATPIYDFGKVKSGEVVKYSYIFTNGGEQVLEIRDVHACGCIVFGDWTKKVEPGHTGSIPMSYNSAGFPSGPVGKTISVTSSDKAQPTAILQFKGAIWREVDVNPQFASLNIPPDAQSGSTVVTITNNTELPLLLSDLRCGNPAFVAQLKTNYPGWGYEVLVSRVPPLSPGTSQAQVTLKTSFTNLPVITFTAWANVQPPLVVVPPQLTLPQAPLVSTQTLVVTIQAFTTNGVVLSEPNVAAKDVQVALKEVQGGHYFTASLTFPKGFELPPGQQTEFSIKTSNPQYPLVKVPILQLPRPVTPPPAPAQPVVRQLPFPPRPASH